jgi:hypothetical protein
VIFASFAVQSRRRRAPILVALAGLTVAAAMWPAGAGNAAQEDGAIAAQAAVREDGRYLPPNTWVRLDTVPTPRFIPRDFTDCTRVGMLSHPVGRRASSVVYGDAGIFYFGGGGQSNPANDVELFDIGSNTWIQQYQPECLPSCCNPGRCVDGVVAGRACTADTDCQGSQCGEGQCFGGPRHGNPCVSDSACDNRLCTTNTCGGEAGGLVCARDSDCAGSSCFVCDPACYVAGGVGTEELTSMGRPYVEHAYQLVAYNPLRRRYTYAHTSGLWEWDPASKAWSRLTPERPSSSDIATKMLVYDPDLETVLYFATTQVNHTVFRFDYSTNTWVVHGPIPERIAWATIFSTYDSREHKYLVSHGSGTLWIYDARAGTWAQLENVPAEITLRSGVAQFSMAYDPTAGVCLIATKDSANNVQLWSYHLPSDTWSNLVSTAGTPRGPAPDYNGLAYDRVWKRFYFLNTRSTGGGGQGGTSEGDAQTWAYRIAGSVGPGDSNCDGVVSAADLSGLVQSLGSDPTEGCGAVDTNRDAAADQTDLSNVVSALFEVSMRGLSTS